MRDRAEREIQLVTRRRGFEWQRGERRASPAQEMRGDRRVWRAGADEGEAHEDSIGPIELARSVRQWILRREQRAQFERRPRAEQHGRRHGNGRLEIRYVER